MAAYIDYSGLPAAAVKGLLGAGFIITGVCIVGSKAASGLFTPTVLLSALISVPAVLAGSRLGIWLSSFINETVYRKILFMGIALMGAQVMINSLF